MGNAVNYTINNERDDKIMSNVCENTCDCGRVSQIVNINCCGCGNGNGLSNEIAVNGTMERCAVSANVWTKIKFIPVNGDVQDINADGEWICPESGIYHLSASFGYAGLNALTRLLSGFAKNVSSSLSPTDLWGYASVDYDNTFPQSNALVVLEKGDNISLWIYSYNQRTLTSSPSNFTIKLESTI
jgi:hypothetical protein